MLTIILSILSGVAYRCGGTSLGTKWRDFGVPIIALITIWLLDINIAWWTYLLTFGCMFGVMTTYFKFGNQQDVYWYNWAIVGFMMGLSALPIAWTTGAWIGFGIRTVVLAVLIMLWSEKIDEVNLEEGGRGFLFTATLPLLLIGG